MTVSTTTIDRIVANVLNQLGAASVGVPALQAKPADGSAGSVSICERVVTAGLLENLPCESVAIVALHAIITPAAVDMARQREIRIERVGAEAVQGNSSVGRKVTSDAVGAVTHSGRGLLIVVRNTDALDRLWEEISPIALRELVDCPDDAAKLAISSICRGDAGHVVICAEHVHRTACLANRNERVKAAVVNDLGDIKAVRRQLRANVWCLDPSARTYFEIRQLHREISNQLLIPNS